MLTVDNAGALVAPLSPKGKTMKVKVLRGTMADGQRAKAGDVVDVPADVAHTLIASQKAETYVEPPPKPKAKAKAKADE